MQYQLRLEPKVIKQLKKISVKDQAKILSVLPAILLDPFIGKKLDGELKGLYSFRIWPYRIIYKIYKDQLLILVINIGHRQGIYN